MKKQIVDNKNLLARLVLPSAFFALMATSLAAPAKKPVAKTSAAKKAPAAKKSPAAKKAHSKPVVPLITLRLQLPRPAFRISGPSKRIPADFEGERPKGKPRPIFYVPKGTTNLALNKTGHRER